MIYLLKALKKNFVKKVILHRNCIAIVILYLFAGQSINCQVPDNSFSLLNMHDYYKTVGFRKNVELRQKVTIINGGDTTITDTNVVIESKIKPVEKEFVEYMFYPYWLGDIESAYSFDSIGRFGYFAYVIRPEDGLPNETFSNNMFNIIDAPERKDTRIDIVLFCDGRENTDYFLKSTPAVDSCITYITGIINNHDLHKESAGIVDGVNVFFPDFTFDEKRSFGLFIKKLFWKLKPENANQKEGEEMLVQSESQKKIIVSFPFRDTIHFNYMLGLKHYIDELHFVNFNSKGKMIDKEITKKYAEDFGSESDKLNLVEEVIAQVRIAEFVNPLSNIKGAAEENMWEIYFIAIVAIIFVIFCIFFVTGMFCRFNQLKVNHLTLFVLLIILLVIEILILIVFMIEEMTYDTWLINTDNSASNYFLLTPLALILLFPLIKLLQKHQQLP
jgi:hypothetical protein